jgi:hypothetical protein
MNDQATRRCMYCGRRVKRMRRRLNGRPVFYFWCPGQDRLLLPLETVRRVYGGLLPCR